MSRALPALELAREHAEAGRFEQGIALLLRHLRQSPRDVPATILMAELHIRQRLFERAEFYYAKAVALAPNHGQLLSDHGQTLLALGRTDQAIARFREALRVDPLVWMASSGLAQAHLNKHEFREAITVAEEGIRKRPGVPDLHNHLARGLMLAGQIEESIAAARRGLEVAPGHPRLGATLAVALTYSERATADEIRRAYRDTGAALGAGREGARIIWPNSREPDRVIRIGYLSPDLRLHSVAYFMEPVLAHHDPSVVTVSAYSVARAPDLVTERLKRLVVGRGGEWVDCSALGSEAIVQRVRDDRLDLLIDLAGHSHGGLLSLMVPRLAPVQATYLGWPSTSGVPTIDWRIVDGRTDPEGYEGHSTERLARMPGCFVCYGGEGRAPAPSLPDGPPVFGSFNAVYKITPTCVSAWAAAMRLTPGSRMIIKAEQLEHEDLRRRIMGMFSGHGIESSRLSLEGRTPELVDHFNAYGRVHVALDTFPYNGTTTTCEALWQGVPVVTLEGGMHAGRVSASLLHALGAPEWIARDEAGFARIASSLARDQELLASLRAGLRERMRASPLCDGVAFTRDLESCYRRMWREWCGREAT